MQLTHSNYPYRKMNEWCNLLYLLSRPTSLIITYCDHNINKITEIACITAEPHRKVADTWGLTQS